MKTGGTPVDKAGQSCKEQPSWGWLNQRLEKWYNNSGLLIKKLKKQVHLAHSRIYVNGIYIRILNTIIALSDLERDDKKKFPRVFVTQVIVAHMSQHLTQEKPMFFLMNNVIVGFGIIVGRSNTIIIWY